MKDLKALEILKEMQEQNQDSPYIEELNEAITELEALQAPKTCDGCESLFVHTNQCMYEFGCERILSLGIYKDYYTPKAQQ